MNALHLWAPEGGESLPDHFIRRVLGNPKSGPHAQNNARQAAILVEADREHMRKVAHVDEQIELHKEEIAAHWAHIDRLRVERGLLEGDDRG